MGKTATELRYEIDQRRSDISRDLEAIGDRVSPHRMVERKTDAVKSRFRRMKDSVMGTADDMGGSAQQRAIDLREHASETAHNATAAAQGAVETVAENVAEVPQLVRTQTQGNPLAAGMVAFGLGLIAATVLPPSRKERELARHMQPQLEEAARMAAETGREMAEELRPVVEESATTIQDSAKEAVQRVADTAKESASTVAGGAKDAAGNVADAARS